MLTRTAGVELGPHGILVVGVGPGAVETPINLETMKDPAKMKTLDTAIPLGRMAKSAEIGAVVAFLAGEGASYLTATTIFADWRPISILRCRARGRSKPPIGRSAAVSTWPLIQLNPCWRRMTVDQIRHQSEFVMAQVTVIINGRQFGAAESTLTARLPLHQRYLAHQTF